MVNGKKIRRSATCKSCLCSCRNASSFRSSRSNSSNGAASRKHGNFTRTLNVSKISNDSKSYHHSRSEFEFLDINFELFVLFICYFTCFVKIFKAF